MNTAKAVQRGKFIAMSAFIKRAKRSQINNLMLPLRCLEKQEQVKAQNKQKEKNNKNKGQN
jgi:hypothetical protein